MIFLRSGDLTVPVERTTEATDVSPHTGNELCVLTATVRGSERSHQDFMDELTKGERWEGRDESDGSESVWTATCRSWAETNGRYTYTLQLREWEPSPQAEQLVLDGSLELAPERYRKEVERSAVIATAIAQVDGEQEEQFLSLVEREGFFPVRRVGVSDDEVEMRFGNVSWSQNDEGKRYIFTLVAVGYDRAEDAKSFTSTYNRENELARDHLAYLQGYVTNLVDELKDAGVVNDEMIERVEARAEEGRFRRGLAFDEVKDVDLLF